MKLRVPQLVVYMYVLLLLFVFHYFWIFWGFFQMNYEHKLEVFLKMQDHVVPSFVGLLHTLAMDALGDAFKVYISLDAY